VSFLTAESVDEPHQRAAKEGFVARLSRFIDQAFAPGSPQPKLNDSEGSCKMVVGLGGPGRRSLKRFGGRSKEEVAHEADLILAHQPWRMADAGNFHDTSFRAGSTHPPCRRG
jgi:hypothetical protein